LVGDGAIVGVSVMVGVRVWVGMVVGRSVWVAVGMERVGVRVATLCGVVCGISVDRARVGRAVGMGIVLVGCGGAGVSRKAIVGRRVRVGRGEAVTLGVGDGAVGSCNAPQTLITWTSVGRGVSRAIS
jgi:hypothetical protein